MSNDNEKVFESDEIDTDAPSPFDLADDADVESELDAPEELPEELLSGSKSSVEAPVVAAPVTVERKVERKEEQGEALLGASSEEAAVRPSKKEKEPAPTLRELDPVRAALPWYVVHTYSGFEARVKLSLEERSRSHNLESSFGNILVPQETVMELKKGQKKTSTRKYFPGYILVQMDLNDETWHLVKDTPKVTGFIGDERNPSPVTDQEMATLLKQLEGGGLKPKPKVSFEQGDAVKVIDGPFADFNGTVDDVKPDKGKLRVLISIFGRNTPVELEFVQVEKV